MEPNQPSADSHDNLNQNPMLTTFMEITSSTQEEAQFFLESHNFDLDAAVSTFFESTTVPTATTDDLPLSPQPHPSSPSASPSPSPSRSRSSSPPAPGSRSQYNLRSRPRGGVRTFADLQAEGSGGDEDDSDSDRPNQYFTGGQRSGMLVQDPRRDNDPDAMFEQAKSMAVEGPADVHQPSSSSRSFTGTARLLSGGMISSSPNELPPDAVTHTVTFWRNGFTVDDGPLRMFDDPVNASLLQSIIKSECPAELEPKDRRTSVRVNLVKKDEDCPEPKKRKTPFQGVGRTLGSSSSAVTSEPPAVLNSAPPPVMGLVVDDQMPSTSIQLRLADGTRMVSRFNNHHTVRDIHAFIDASRPSRAGAYTLQMMGFPPKQLTDLGQTIEQAGLANSVVIQKF